MSTYFWVILMVSFWAYVAERCCKRSVLLNDKYYIIQTKSTKICIFIIVATLVITAGFRHRVGTDYKSYMFLYEIYNSMNWKELFTWDEPILPIIGNICGKIFGSYVAMFFIASLLTIGLALRSMYQETTDFVFVTLLYIFLGCWHGSFNGIRQYLAVTVIFLGREYIINRKFLKYCSVCFIAFLCHKSALVFVLLYFLYSKRITLGRLIIVLTGTLIVSQSYETIFNLIGWLNDSEFVITEYTARSVNSLRVLVGCCPAILAIYFAFSYKLNEIQIFYVYMMVANAVMRIATSGSAYLARMGSFTSLFVPLGLSCILETRKNKQTQIIRISIIILYLLYWIYEIKSSQTLYEFEWIFGNL